MIKIHGKTFDYKRATKLVQGMQEEVIEPNAITYSTLISIYGKVEKYERARHLSRFDTHLESRIQIDEILYRIMAM
jgi:hypothetical protein